MPQQARKHIRRNGKKLMVVLFDPGRATRELHRTGKRCDQEIVEFLNSERFDCFDMNQVHLKDAKKYAISFDEYLKPYFIGHFNPRGNHFFAFSIKDRLVEWPDAKPITYHKASQETIGFRCYLSNERDR